MIRNAVYLFITSFFCGLLDFNSDNKILYFTGNLTIDLIGLTLNLWAILLIFKYVKGERA